MDFTLALTHFCEVHGPKSVLCTQVLPLECTLCVPPPIHLRSQESFVSYNAEVGQEAEPKPTPRLRRSDTGFSITPGLSKASTADEDQSTSPSIESHPRYLRFNTSFGEPHQTEEPKKFPYGRAHGETCASCSFTVPQNVAAKLPEGAPGSLKDGGKTKNGAPVLRSREFVCLGKDRRRQTQEPSSSQESHASSIGSFNSVISHGDCHDHTLTYLTSKSPDDPESYKQLRGSVIRALSFEVLPKGMSEGPFCFGDSSSGYTIAYVFRLTDPKARGRRRAYAFVALAGKDACRAFKACPLLWEAFATMSKIIEQAAQRYQDKQEKQEKKAQAEESLKHDSKGYTEPSSFLTQRPRDRDGTPRRTGQTLPKSLAEIIGDENIFAILHQYFVYVLKCLGQQFGGVPFSDAKTMVYQTAVDDQGFDEAKSPTKAKEDMLGALDIKDDNRPKQKVVTGPNTPNPIPRASPVPKAIATANAKAAATNFTTSRPTSADKADSSSATPKQVKRNSQCAPIPVDNSRQPQVIV